MPTLLIPPALPAPAPLLAQSIPTLPSPPTIEHYLFENPWPAVIVLTLGALVVATALNRQGRSRQARLAAVGLLAGAIAVGVTASLVTTTREVLIQHSKSLVNATAAADLASLRDMLASDAELRAAFLTQTWTRDRLLDGVEQYLGQRYPIQSHGEDSIRATIDGPNAARTQMHVVVRSTDATAYDVPIGSWWRIEWRKSDDGTWRVRGLECLHLSAVATGTKISP